MKPFRIFYPFAAAMVFAAAMASISSSAPAQNSPVAQATPAQSGTIDVNFEAVTLGEIVSYIREKYKNTNIVLGPGAADVTVNELKLHAVDVPTLLEAVRLAADRPLAVSTLAESASNGWYLGLLNNAPPAPPEITVFNLSGYFTQQHQLTPEEIQKSTADLADIIDKTVAMYRDYELAASELKSEDAVRPKYLFHNGANLLVIIGTPEIVDIARKVLNALPGINPSHNTMGFTSGGTGWNSNFNPQDLRTPNFINPPAPDNH